MTQPANTQIKLVITGPSNDPDIQQGLAQRGYELVFITPESSLEPTSNFNFKYLHPAIQYAKAHDFDMVFGVDVALGKLGVAVRKSPDQNFVMLNAHQLAALLTSLWARDEPERLIFLKSVHVSELISVIAGKANKKCLNTVIKPGDLEKQIAEVTDSSDEVAVAGFTENQEIYHSDKSFQEIIEDVVSLQQDIKAEGMTLFDELVDLYLKYGFYKERTFVVDFVSAKQKEHIMNTMTEVRKDPRPIAERLSVRWAIDYRRGRATNLLTGKVMKLDSEKEDVIKLELTNGSVITFVPSGDKMTYYLSIKSGLQEKNDYFEESQKLDERMIKMMEVINQLK